MLRRTRAAIVPLAAAACLAAAATPVNATGSRTPTTTDPAKAAAGWLARQLTGPHRDHYADGYGPEYGTTIDGILGMDAAGVARQASRRATRWLARHIRHYVQDSPAYCGKQRTYSPGALAKAMLAAEAGHRDVRDFGGVNLLRRLQASEAKDGLYTDPNPSCGYQSPITQALALIALTHTGSAPDRKARQWLVGQQCADGGYVDTVRHPGTACDRSAEDVDTTGFVIQALVQTKAPASVTRHALRWLAGQQSASGGFGSGAGGDNTNSTAVAAQALLAAGWHHAARRAQAWIARRQEGCDAPAGRRGSLDYQHGYTTADTQLTATTQGTQALAGGVLGEISGRGASWAAPVLPCP